MISTASMEVRYVCRIKFKDWYPFDEEIQAATHMHLSADKHVRRPLDDDPSQLRIADCVEYDSEGSFGRGLKCEGDKGYMLIENIEFLA